MPGHLHRPLFRSALTHEYSSVAAETKRRPGLQLRERGERNAGVSARSTPGEEKAQGNLSRSAGARPSFRPRPGERSV